MRRINLLIISLFLQFFCFHFGHQTLAQQTDKSVYHIVKKNNTLYSIARQYGVTLEKIKGWNGLSNNTIYPGQRLLVKPVKQGLVKPAPLSHPNNQSISSRPTDTGLGHRPPVNFPSSHQKENPSEGRDNKMEEIPFPWDDDAKEAYDFSMPSVKEEDNASFHNGDPLSLEVNDRFDQIKLRVEALVNEMKQEDILMLGISGQAKEKGNSISIKPSEFRSEDDGIVLDTLIGYLGEVECRKLIVWDVNMTREMIKEHLFIPQQYRKNDIAVLAACWDEAPTGREVWKNGALMNALQEALKGAADMDRDGKIRLSEIDMYLNDRVKELTGNQQYGFLALNYFHSPNPVVVDLQ